VTEREWLACTDPRRMLRFLSGVGGDRKLRLFTVACFKLLLLYLGDDRGEAVIEVLERHAEGSDGAGELSAAHLAVSPARLAAQAHPFQLGVFEEVVGAATLPSAFGAAWMMAGAVPDAIGRNALSEFESRHWWERAREKGREAHDRASAQAEQQEAALLRDLFGPLPLGRISIPPAVLAWQGGTVVKMATAIYEGRRWEDMPLLGDALEDAGCTDADLLGHLRGPGPHVRGCWAVDLLLGKE
jgi:hypothetical protein